MGVTDPIADMLTVLRNAVSANKDTVEVKNSRMTESILRVLKEEKFIDNYKVLKDTRQGTCKVYLKYYSDKSPAILGLERISTPGRRKYVGKDEVPRVLEGLGISIISTPKGVLTGKKAVEEKVGGEVICHVW